MRKKKEDVIRSKRKMMIWLRMKKSKVILKQRLQTKHRR